MGSLCKGIIWTGIELNDENDTLVWSWNTKGGQVNAKQAYEVQCLDDHEVISNEWYLDLWNWKMPLRIKLFCWLMFENRILTWDNLSKRGLIGPSRCVLCGEREESLNHLMVECLFTKEIWNSILNEFHLQRNWGGGLLCDCYQVWIKEMEYWKELPCYICWEIWKHRNMIIFEEHNLSLARVCNKILQDLGENKKIQNCSAS
jgi:hypothetical protein